MVVFVHLPQIGISLLSIDSFYLDYLDFHNYLFGCFYMPAFFYLTGFCSNYSIGFKSFFIKNIKSILIPAIAFSIIVRVLEQYLEVNEAIANYHLKNYITLVLNCGSFWFLKSLFISKMILFLMKKILNNEFLTLCIAILLSFLSSFANQTFFFNDRFCFVQALMLMPAIAMGALIKARSIHVNYWSGFLAVSCFILGIVIHVLLQLPIPIV